MTQMQQPNSLVIERMHMFHFTSTCVDMTSGLITDVLICVREDFLCYFFRVRNT